MAGENREARTLLGLTSAERFALFTVTHLNAIQT
jgi:hypothetical protein